MPVIPFPQQFPPGHIHSTMHQAGHTIRKVLSLLRQHLPENRGILAYRSEVLIPLTYKTPHRDLIPTVYLSDQSLPQLTGRGCGIHVSATLRFSDDGVNPVSYTHLRAHETKANLVCRLLLEKKKKKKKHTK